VKKGKLQKEIEILEACLNDVLWLAKRGLQGEQTRALELIISRIGAPFPTESVVKHDVLLSKNLNYETAQKEGAQC
jgi:hypothetical protein